MAKSKWVLIITVLLFACRKQGDDKFDFCSLKSKDLDSVANFLVTEKKQLANSVTDNDCVFDIITKLRKNSSFEALEVMASNSDDVVAEYFTDETVRLLEDDPVAFIDYLGTSHGALFQFLADGLSMKLSMTKADPEHLKAELASKLTTETQKINSWQSF
ncbi:MAG: hypothetical protein WDO14_00340 [Bacteroidota bacterium]